MKVCFGALTYYESFATMTPSLEVSSRRKRQEGALAAAQVININDFITRELIIE